MALSNGECRRVLAVVCAYVTSMVLPLMPLRADYAPRSGFVTLQFDDTHYYDYTDVFPLLELHGFKGSFGYVTEVSDLGIEHDPWMMQEIYQAGHEVQDHTTRHDYMWATHVDTVDDGIDEWIPYTFADVATWDSLCERSLYILDSLGIEVVGWNHPGGGSKSVPGHPDWKWLGDVDDSLYELIGTKYPYALAESVDPGTAHLNLRGHNYPDRFPFFNVPHVAIDHRGLDEIKTGIADAVASGLWYLAVAHPRTPECVAKVESLVEWLDQEDVEVLTCFDGWQRVQYGVPDPCGNQLPQARMLTDLDANGKPDGFQGSCTRDTMTTAPVDGALCMQVYGVTWFYCYGPEVGSNALSLWVKSATGIATTARVIWTKVGFDWELLGNLETWVDVPSEWTRIDTSDYPGLLIAVGDEVDRILLKVVPTGEALMVANPEIVLTGAAGIPSAGRAGDGRPDLTVVPNPVAVGVPLRIISSNPVGIYDVLGRCLSGGLECGAPRETEMSTVGLAPGVYFIRAPSGHARPVKVVVYR